MPDHNSCIYQIENTVNGKIYVGQTKDYHDRVLSHISSLKRGRAANMHLQRAWDKYGEDLDPSSLSAVCGERKRGHSCGKHPVTGAQLYWEYIINNRNDVT